MSPSHLFRPTLLATVAASALLLSACGSDETPVAADPGSASTSQSPSASTSELAASDVSCSWTETGDAAKDAELPPTTPLATGDVAATLVTSSGDIPVTLDAAHAPCTVTSFMSLASQGYFDDTSCHRLTTEGIYVLQCGDPSGTGMGGPGYSFDDELSADGDTYPAGTLAMANAGPSTNGSQFFLCYDDCTALDASPAYTVFGTISEEGMTVLADIAAQGTTEGLSDGTPKASPTIESVTIS